MINDFKALHEQKIQLSVTINYMPFNDIDETRTMDSKRDKTEITNRKKSEEVIHGLFGSLLDFFLKKNLELSTERVHFLMILIYSIINDLK